MSSLLLPLMALLSGVILDVCVCVCVYMISHCQLPPGRKEPNARKGAKNVDSTYQISVKRISHCFLNLIDYGEEWCDVRVLGHPLIFACIIIVRVDLSIRLSSPRPSSPPSSLRFSSMRPSSLFAGILRSSHQSYHCITASQSPSSRHTNLC